MAELRGRAERARGLEPAESSAPAALAASAPSGRARRPTRPREPAAARARAMRDSPRERPRGERCAQDLDATGAGRARPALRRGESLTERELRRGHAGRRRARPNRGTAPIPVLVPPRRWEVPLLIRVTGSWTSRRPRAGPRPLAPMPPAIGVPREESVWLGARRMPRAPKRRAEAHARFQPSTLLSELQYTAGQVLRTLRRHGAAPKPSYVLSTTARRHRSSRARGAPVARRVRYPPRPSDRPTGPRHKPPHRHPADALLVRTDRVQAVQATWPTGAKPRGLGVACPPVSSRLRGAVPPADQSPPGHHRLLPRGGLSARAPQARRFQQRPSGRRESSRADWAARRIDHPGGGGTIPNVTRPVCAVAAAAGNVRVVTALEYRTVPRPRSTRRCCSPFVRGPPGITPGTKSVVSAACPRDPAPWRGCIQFPAAPIAAGAASGKSFTVVQARRILGRSTTARRCVRAATELGPDMNNVSAMVVPPGSAPSPGTLASRIPSRRRGRISRTCRRRPSTVPRRPGRPARRPSGPSGRADARWAARLGAAATEAPAPGHAPGRLHQVRPARVLTRRAASGSRPGDRIPGPSRWPRGRTVARYRNWAERTRRAPFYDDGPVSACPAPAHRVGPERPIPREPTIKEDPAAGEVAPRAKCERASPRCA
jgi:hypothetical protein